MKKHFAFALIGLCSLGLLAEDGTASVRLVKPLAVTKDKDLFFGDYILNSDPVVANTAVMMEASGNAGGDVFSIGGSAVTKYTGVKNQGDPHTARFTITGEPNLLCQVNAPTAPINLNNNHGHEGKLTIKAAPTGDWEWTSYPAANGSFSIVLMDGRKTGIETLQLDGGVAKFYVGGVLELVQGTKSGLYSGSFPVNVSYN